MFSNLNYIYFNQQATTNPKDITTGGGGLFPLGGPEESSGYKGYGLMFLGSITFIN